MSHFKAEVIKGQGKGRGIGFATMNLELKAGQFLQLSHGVYGCKVKIMKNEDFANVNLNKLRTTNHLPDINVIQAGESRITYYGVMHYGQRETLNLPSSLEIHLLDFEDRDLYGYEVEVEVLEKIRDVKKFESVEKLKEQIEKDIELFKKSQK